MTITEYLVALLTELPLPGRARRRILAEVEDHLLCAMAELYGDGLDAEAAELEAVRRFGSPGDLARSFVTRQAARSGARLGHSALILSAVVSWVAAPARFGEVRSFLPALLWFVLAQVAVVVGGLTWVRAMAARRAGHLEARGLTLVMRGAWVTVACAAVGLMGLLRVLSNGRALPPGEVTGSLAMIGLGIACAAMSRRCRRLVVSAGASKPGVAPAGPSRAVSVTGGGGEDLVLLGADRAAQWLRARSPRLARWLDLRTHPWRFALVVAGAAGLALAGAHGVIEGPPSARLLLGGLEAGVIIASVEATITLLGFAALGRALGLRPGARSEVSATD